MAPILFLSAGLLMFLLTNYLSSLVGFHILIVVAWLFFSLVFFALGLYSLRLWSRLLYGLVELSFGMAITIVAISAYGAAQSREYVPIAGGGIFHRSPEGVLQLSGPEVALFGMLAAIYVLVRGLDNVGEGLRQHPRLSAYWYSCFHGPTGVSK
jgi:hypothetical protein